MLLQLDATVYNSPRDTTFSYNGMGVYNLVYSPGWYVFKYVFRDVKVTRC
jgi:hypothetical protein